MHGSGVHTADRWSSLCYLELHSIPDHPLGALWNGLHSKKDLNTGDMSLLMANTAAIRFIVVAPQCYVEENVCNLLHRNGDLKGEQILAVDEILVSTQFGDDHTNHCIHCMNDN
jgi:hypothetical protein